MHIDVPSLFIGILIGTGITCGGGILLYYRPARVRIVYRRPAWWDRRRKR